MIYSHVTFNIISSKIRTVHFFVDDSINSIIIYFVWIIDGPIEFTTPAIYTKLYKKIT